MVKIAVVDLETTGPKFQKEDRIIQIGAVIIENGYIIHEYSMLVNPERGIPENIQHLTNIKDEDVINAPTFESVASLWQQRLKDCVFVAHNLTFDLKCLMHVFKQMGIDFNPEAVDSEILSKIFLPESSGFNLFDLSQYLNLSYVQAHDALSDARVTAQIMNKIAQKYLVVDPNIQEDIMQIISSIEYNQVYFFKHPDLFLLCDDFCDKPSKILMSSAAPKLPSSFPSICHNPEFLEIFEGENDNYYLEYPLIPGQKHPYLPLFQQLFAYQKYFWLSLSTEKEMLIYFQNIMSDKNVSSDRVTIYLSPNHFIHKQAFEYVCQNHQNFGLNHIQLVQLASVMYWLSYTKKGLYSEINDKLNIQDMLKEYANQKRCSSSNTYYQQMLQQLNHADLVLSTHDSLMYAYLHEKKLLNILSKYQLVVSDVGDIYKTYQYWHKISLPLSAILVYFQSIIEDFQMYSLKEDMLTVVNDLDKFLTEIEKYSNFTEANLSSYHHSFTAFFNKKDALYKIYLENLIHSIYKVLKAMIQSEHVFSEMVILQAKKYIQVLLNYMNNMEDTFALIHAKVVNKYPYRWEIIEKPLKLSDAFFEWIRIFKGAYLLNAELTLASKNVYEGLFNVPANYNYKKLTFKTDPKNNQTIYMPLAYTRMASNHEFAMVDQYILDNIQKLSSHIIVVMPNNQACQDLYQMMVQKMAEINYSMYTRGMTGSHSKSFRQFIQDSNSILILVKSKIDQLPFEDFDQSYDLLIHSLPFKSMNNPYVKMLAYQIKDISTDYDLTEDILLPIMVKDLFEILTYFKESTILNKVIIFDERLFTKTYSYRLRQALQNYVQLIMEE